MPLYRIVLLNFMLLLVLSACSDDDDNSHISLQDARLSFNDSMGWVHAMPPDAMLVIQEWPVQKTLEFLGYANASLRLNKDNYFRQDRLVATAVVDTAVSDAKPGVRYRTSLFLNPSREVAYAYEVSIERKTYIFRVFQKIIAFGDVWVLKASAEERIDQKEGMMKVYECICPADPIRTYTWQRDGDEFLLSLVSTLDVRLEGQIKINQRTRAGSLVLQEEDGPRFESSWTASGAGEWVQYMADGTTVDTEGVWEAAQ
jgi:hypothetical protein